MSPLRDPLDAVITYLRRLESRSFFGSAKLLYEKGAVKRILIEESILVENVNPPSDGLTQRSTNGTQRS